jgi:hypothetical protein
MPFTERLWDLIKRCVRRPNEVQAVGPAAVSPARANSSPHEDTGPDEQFLGEVRKYKGQRIRRPDWMPGEYFTPDGGSEVIDTDKLADDLMTGILVTPSGERKAAFYPFETWVVCDGDENWNRQSCPGDGGELPDGVTYRVVLDSPTLTDDQLRDNDAALRDICRCWQDQAAFVLRLWRLQERFTPAITYNTLAGGLDRWGVRIRGDTDKYSLQLAFHRMNLNGYTTAIEQPTTIRLGVCKKAEGFIEPPDGHVATPLFLEVGGWRRRLIPTATFCRRCGQPARQDPYESFVCRECGTKHEWRWHDRQSRCSQCQSELQGGSYCVVCCAATEGVTTDANQPSEGTR